jgi:arylsulfatase A-like enzyme
MENPRSNLTAASAGAPGSMAGDPAEKVSKRPAGSGSFFALAVWLGLAVGVIELLLVCIDLTFDPTRRLQLRLLNRHYLWMIPAAELIYFGACGVFLGFCARFWPKAARPIAAYLLCGLAALELIVYVRDLHRLTYILLACGFASLAAPFVRAKIRHRPLRPGGALCSFIALIAALACFSYGRALVREHRACARLGQAPAGAPNVLLIVLDTVRADALSLYGYARDTSPNLARLARRGVRFDRARATAPWTLPAHASIFTGRWPHELDVDSHRPLDGRYRTLAEALGAMGYVTAGFVANPLFCHADYGLARGFLHYEDIPVSFLEVIRAPLLGERVVKAIDFARYRLFEWIGEERLVRVLGDDARDSYWRTRERKNAARINRDALNWISAQEPGRPFFVFLNYFDTHDPYVPPRGAGGRFGRIPSSPEERAVIRLWTSPESDHNQPRALIEMARDCYDDCIAYLDDQLGRLFDELEARGIFENTVVVITADHGEHFGEHAGLLGHRQSVYSQEIRVPLVVTGPRRVPPQRVVSAPVSLRDLPATVVDVAGLGGQVSLPGRSLARYWESDGANEKSAAAPALSENEKNRLAENDGERWRRSIAIGDLVYIRNAHGDEELYNIETDPEEQNNLASLADSRLMLQEFRTSLQRVLAADPDPSPRPDGSVADADSGRTSSPAIGE